MYEAHKQQAKYAQPRRNCEKNFGSGKNRTSVIPSKRKQQVRYALW